MQYIDYMAAFCKEKTTYKKAQKDNQTSMAETGDNEKPEGSLENSYTQYVSQERICLLADLAGSLG